jgi:hypothetical protein
MMPIFPTTFVVSGTPSSGRHQAVNKAFLLLLVVASTTVKKDRPPDRFIVRFGKKLSKIFHCTRYSCTLLNIPEPISCTARFFQFGQKFWGKYFVQKLFIVYAIYQHSLHFGADFWTFSFASFIISVDTSHAT